MTEPQVSTASSMFSSNKIKAIIFLNLGVFALFAYTVTLKHSSEVKGENQIEYLLIRALVLTAYSFLIAVC